MVCQLYIIIIWQVRSMLNELAWKWQRRKWKKRSSEVRRVRILIKISFVHYAWHIIAWIKKSFSERRIWRCHRHLLHEKNDETNFMNISSAVSSPIFLFTRPYALHHVFVMEKFICIICLLFLFLSSTHFYMFFGEDLLKKLWTSNYTQFFCYFVGLKLLQIQK